MSHLNLYSLLITTHPQPGHGGRVVVVGSGVVAHGGEVGGSQGAGVVQFTIGAGQVTVGGGHSSCGAGQEVTIPGQFTTFDHKLH